MKQNDLFIHPDKQVECMVTRYYSNNAWYYKETNSDVEIRTTLSADTMEILGSKTETKVKIDVDKMITSQWNFSDIFLAFLEKSRDKIFYVDYIKAEIVHLKDIPYTFWIDYIIVL